MPLQTFLPAMRLAAIACVLVQAGCAQTVLLGYLIGGPPSIEPDFDAQTGFSLTDEGVTVAVVCYAPNELKWDFEKIDDEIAAAVTQRLAMANVKVMDPDYVRAWTEEHPDWERPEEIGAVFETDYVIDIEINTFSLYEENSSTLYRGRTDALVNVVKMDDPKSGLAEGERIYSKQVDLVYPTRIPRSTQEESYLQFKRDYLSRLSESIGWIFTDRFHGDMIGWAT